MSKNQDSTGVGIVVPLANEASTIIGFLDRVTAQIGQADRVYCILDNLSRDETIPLIRKFMERDERVELIWAPENRCVVDAYFRGYREAYERGHAHILEMDGGLSHLPEEMPRFFAKAAEGFEFVGGSRFMTGGRHQSHPRRVFVSYSGTVLAKLVLRAKMTDMTSGFELFSRKTMKAVLDQGVKSRANFFQTEIRFLMHRFKWTEVPITYKNDRPEIGRSAIRESLRLLWDLRRNRHAILSAKP